LKGDYLLSGDVDGVIQVFNIKQKQTKYDPIYSQSDHICISFRSFSTRRNPVRKVRFAPGKGNFRAFVLFNDGVDIWDIRDVFSLITFTFH